MRGSLLEYLILYLLVICAALIVATLTRMSVVAFGLDNFTANMVFIITLGLSAIVYFIIQAFLLEVMLPCIEKLLMKIPNFKKQRTEYLFNEEEKAIENQRIALVDIEKERKESRQLEKIQKEQQLNVALDYARKTFAPYTTDSRIEDLCKNIILYVRNPQEKTFQSITVSDKLTTTDIYHFGWNIWHHFGIGKQIDIAYFLKAAFAHTLRDVEVSTIKSHLKDDENKGLIRIKENLLV
jgi:hypothetical protein